MLVNTAGARTTVAAVEAWLKSPQPSVVAPNDYQALLADEESVVPEYEDECLVPS
jgi:hypothetical protein